MRLQRGPWGGGNQFGLALSEFLQKKNVHISFDLRGPLDIIVLTEPRKGLKSCAYSHEDIIQYLTRKSWETLVVHRINECDERKGTKGVNDIILRANRYADHTVFISYWLKGLFEKHGFEDKEFSVIYNGADTRIFNAMGYQTWDGTGRLRMITHHWSSHYMKGFDIYSRLDELLGNGELGKKLGFTFVGNVPEGFNFRNAVHIPPRSGTALAKIIRAHHVYLTASLNEPAGMHHIEGALCGLPLLYRESGALPEYCRGFGLSFTEDNFEARLLEMIARYHELVPRMAVYPYTSQRMCESYYNLFKNLMERRREVIRRRNFCK